MTLGDLNDPPPRCPSLEPCPVPAPAAGPGPLIPTLSGVTNARWMLGGPVGAESQGSPGPGETAEWALLVRRDWAPWLSALSTDVSGSQRQPAVVSNRTWPHRMPHLTLPTARPHWTLPRECSLPPRQADSCPLGSAPTSEGASGRGGPCPRSLPLASGYPLGTPEGPPRVMKTGVPLPAGLGGGWGATGESAI